MDRSRELVPRVKRFTFRKHDPQAEEADEQYQRARGQVLERDRYTCQFCGFQTRPQRGARKGSYLVSGFLEVHHEDDNHRHNSPENLVSACPFCHQVFHCGNAGHRNAASLVWLPDLTQAEVNMMANLCAVALSQENQYMPAARLIVKGVESTAARVAEAVGVPEADAAALGLALSLVAGRDPEAYRARGETLSGIRLWPKRSAFDKAIGYWAEQAWPPGDQWERIAGLLGKHV